MKIDFQKESYAIISGDKKYRYVLWRLWDKHKPILVIFMLNPSTANASANDPTINRVISFGKANDCGGVIVFNLFALRSTVSSKIYNHFDPIGKDNRKYIDQYLEEVWQFNQGLDPEHNHPNEVSVLCAWGTKGKHMNQDKKLLEEWLKPYYERNVKTYCLDINKDGSPKHPLYVSNSTNIRPYTKRL